MFDLIQFNYSFFYFFILYSIGKSEEGQELWMVDFGPATGDSRYVPETMLVGSLHGDEVVGYEILLQLAYHLCENYGKDYIITQVCLFIRIKISEGTCFFFFSQK